MTKKQVEELWKILKDNAPESVTWNHYDLATNTPQHDAQLWKEFLMRQDVVDWVKEEQTILQKYELAKLSTSVSDSRSVGQAQLLSAMERINEANNTNAKKGPIFIYTYVPLNKEQATSPNVTMADYDLFLAKGENDDLPEYNFDS